jgi:hypothetical protein
MGRSVLGSWIEAVNKYKEFVSLVAKMREAQKKTDDLYCDDEWWHKRAKQLESEIDEYLKKMKI